MITLTLSIGSRIEPRIRPPEEQAESPFAAFENFTLSNTTNFLRKVKNSMSFHGIGVPEMLNVPSDEENSSE